MKHSNFAAFFFVLREINPKNDYICTMQENRKTLLLTDPEGKKRAFPCLTDLCRILKSEGREFSYNYLKNRLPFPFYYKKHLFERLPMEK